jgi:peptidoglycan DL-endopeptidase CwlO
MSDRSVSRHVPRVLAVVAALVVAVPSVHAPVASATSVDDAKRNVERIVDELERLEERSDILTEDYAVAVDDKARLDEEVSAAELQVAAKEGELAELRDDLAAVAVRAFTGAGTDVLGPLFTNASVYNDELQRDQYSRVALSVGTTTADDYDALLSELEQDRAVLERKRNEAEALTAQIEQALADADSLRNEYLQKRAAAEAELGAAIAAEERRRAEESLRQMQAQAAAAQAAASQASAAQTAAAPAAGNGNGGNGGGGATPAPAPAPAGGGGGAAAPAPAAPAPPPPPPPNYPAPSGLAQVAINAALGQLGVPYRYATSNPGVSFDCSGLTHYAWGKAGVYLPRNSRAQAGSLPRVPKDQAQPGDLIFYYSPISHVGIYLGNGQLVHAPNSGTTVKIANVNWSKVNTVARPG